MAYQVELSEADYTLLREIAQRQGKTVEGVLAETLNDLRQTVADQRAFWGERFDDPLPTDGTSRPLSEAEFDAVLEAETQQPTGTA